MSRLADYVDARELVLNLTLRELRSQYKRSALGWTWSLLNPLATMAIFTLVFAFFLRIDPPVGEPSGLHVFALFLLCGLLPWNFLANGMNGSMGALLGNGNLIKKVYFPREVLVLSSVLALAVTLCIELLVLSGVLMIAGNMVLPWIPVLVLLIGIQTVFVLGIGLVLSALNVFFRDVQYLMGIVIQALFYLTPIVYPIYLVEDAAEDHPLLFRLYEANPVVHLVGAYRAVLYDLRFPDLGSLAYLVTWSVALLVIGLAVFRRFEGRLAEEV